ncbi:hypothetical protein CMV_029022 [Castanea mollissima]|uniref:Uncharacterized protein n=1 Tax=Castanea mollissima TaxID=60419 RepID=A0A8J4QC57_9ROSI|nr:hypothetical protein CMV_029022 [Castanea mollissima]
MITHLSQSNGSCASERGNDHVSIEEQVAVGAGAPDYGAASLCELPGPLPTLVISAKGNEIIVKKKRVKVPKKDANQKRIDNADRPTSNPLPPQSEAFADYKNAPKLSAEQIIRTLDF